MHIGLILKILFYFIVAYSNFIALQMNLNQSDSPAFHRPMANPMLNGTSAAASSNLIAHIKTEPSSNRVSFLQKNEFMALFYPVISLYYFFVVDCNRTCSIFFEIFILT